MEKLTREEAICRHRLMWNWIADETEKTGEPINKSDAFKHFGWDGSKVLSSCWCCEYAYEERLRRKPFIKKTMCDLCPLDWSQGDGDVVKSRCVGYLDEHIFFHIGLFEEWMNSSGLCNVNFSFDQERFVSLARTIANLPEKKEEQA